MEFIKMEFINDEPIDSNSDEFVRYDFDILAERIHTYTHGLDKIIPWEKGNFVFTGGLLFDSATNRKQIINTLTDIDLFFYGSSESKIETFKEILSNLEKNDYKYLVGIISSVVFIFIQGIPRIIQLIFTNKSGPSEIISSFDLSHVQSYWDGKDFYSRPHTIMQLISKTTKIKENFKTKPSRLIKYLRRGIDTIEILYSDYNFILDAKQFSELEKFDKTIKFYKDTSNLIFKDINNFTNNFTNDFTDIQEFIPHLSNLYGCKFISNIGLVENLTNMSDLNNLFDDIDFVGTNSDYLKINLDGEFNSKSYKLYICDDNIKLNKSMWSNNEFLSFQTQKYIYLPCRVFQKSTLNKKSLFLQFTKPRVIDYLLGLSEDVEQDLINIKNPLGNKNFNYYFSNHFHNTKTYENHKPDNQIVYDIYGLLCDCEFNEEDVNKYEIGDELFVLFNISINSRDITIDYSYFSFKLKAKMIDKIDY